MPRDFWRTKATGDCLPEMFSPLMLYIAERFEYEDAAEDDGLPF